MSISLRTLYIAAASHHTVQLTDTNHEYYPCVDSTELQRLFDTKLLDYPTFQKYPVGEVFRKLETHLRSDMYLAALGWRKRHLTILFCLVRTRHTRQARSRWMGSLQIMFP